MPKDMELWFGPPMTFWDDYVGGKHVEKLYYGRYIL
jgi:hypothetical protein